MAPPLRNRLIVEGIEEKWVIPQLIEKLGILWGGPNERDKWPAEIIVAGSDGEMLRSGFLSQEWKTPGVENFGVILDADTDAAARWQQLHRLVSTFLPALPKYLSAEGLVHSYDDEGPKKFGVWIMPDNVSKGMLETFLALFVPDRTQGLWPIVAKHCDETKANHQAPYRDAHRDKALIHSWLAIQDPPGQQLHSAIIQTTLIPTSPHAAPFLAWFRRLFDV